MASNYKLKNTTPSIAFHFSRKEDIARAGTKKSSIWNFTVASWYLYPVAHKYVTSRKGRFKKPSRFVGGFMTRSKLPQGTYRNIKIHITYSDYDVMIKGDITVKKDFVRIS